MASKEDAATQALRGLCTPPFFEVTKFDDHGFVDGRFCQEILEGLSCCLPCPMTDWVYPDYFSSLTAIADWVSVAGSISCVYLLLSYAFLPVEKTNRHYLSISISTAVLIMNMGFIIPLAAKPEQCADEITPNSMHTSAVCGASGGVLLFGGFAGVMWICMRSVVLHLQICWQVVAGRNFMFWALAAGWVIPTVIAILTLTLSGVSFRFGATCHINHDYSFAVFWIPLLLVAGISLVLQIATFAYCIKVYLASLVDNSATTEGSNLPYTNSIRTLTPRQAYRRIRRVVAMQWRGILIVLIIVADVIFFSVVFVFQDNTVQAVKEDPEIAQDWIACLVTAFATGGSKDDCLEEASTLVVHEGTVTAVLTLLALNGVWLAFLLARWSMVTGWIELFRSFFSRKKKEFVSVDARGYDLKKDQLTLKPTASPSSGTRTPEYFGQTARYQPPPRSFSSPRPPTSPEPGSNGYGNGNAGFGNGAGGFGNGAGGYGNAHGWDATRTYARPGQGQMPSGYADMNPLGMNRI